MNADAIVKALKCCNVPSGRACSECPYHEVGAECRTQRNRDAVELILELVDERRRCLEALSELADNIGLLKDKERADTVQKMQTKLTDRSEFALRADSNGAMYYVDYATWVEEVTKDMLEGKSDV